jgi:hypothetical protein
MAKPKDARMQGCQDAAKHGMLGCKDAKQQGCKDAITFWHPDGRMQGCRPFPPQGCAQNTLAGMRGCEVCAPLYSAMHRPADAAKSAGLELSAAQRVSCPAKIRHLCVAMRACCKAVSQHARIYVQSYEYAHI